MHHFLGHVWVTQFEEISLRRSIAENGQHGPVLVPRAEIDIVAAWHHKRLMILEIQPDISALRGLQTGAVSYLLTNTAIQNSRHGIIPPMREHSIVSKSSERHSRSRAGMSFELWTGYFQGKSLGLRSPERLSSLQGCMCLCGYALDECICQSYT